MGVINPAPTGPWLQPSTVPIVECPSGLLTVENSSTRRRGFIAGWMKPQGYPTFRVPPIIPRVGRVERVEGYIAQWLVLQLTVPPRWYATDNSHTVLKAPMPLPSLGRGKCPWSNSKPAEPPLQWGLIMVMSTGKPSPLHNNILIELEREVREPACNPPNPLASHLNALRSDIKHPQIPPPTYCKL